MPHTRSLSSSTFQELKLGKSNRHTTLTTTSLWQGHPFCPRIPSPTRYPARDRRLNNIPLLFTYDIIASPTLITKGNYIDSWYSQPSLAMIHISLKAKWLETH